MILESTSSSIQTDRPISPGSAISSERARAAAVTALAAAAAGNSAEALAAIRRVLDALEGENR